jgi:hypothetical protein
MKKPGMLLGKIQSGKTRAFIGVIALAFDNGYDMAIVLTKGTKPLVEQTLKRLSDDFSPFTDERKMQIHDIMVFPQNLVRYELNQKLVIVAKKETNNLKRIIKALVDTYPDLQEKKILIIDDEADLASINFYKSKGTGEIEQGKIATEIDEIRTKVKQSNFLQVTATPYSLYLQPDNSECESIFKPKRPTFTVILEPHENYVGGDYYFSESEDENSPAAHVYHAVPIEELDILKAKKTLSRADRRSFKIEEVFTDPSLEVLRIAIMNFIVGACIRRIQQASLNKKLEDYSFVIHTERSRISHSWQEEIVNRLNQELINIAKNNHLDKLVGDAYEDLKISINLTKLPLPSLDDVKSNVKKAILDEMLIVEKVNSDKDVKALLDTKGQLKLRTPLNIFIGGQILDRGLTIKNLIGFYYGRHPKRFQQDTVLQHSRMYGARSKEDLAVTRFYTTRDIYEIMKIINEFDNALKDAFNNKSLEGGVVFIRKDETDKIVPCSPNKILLSKIITLKPLKRLLPIGFNTDYKTKIQKDIQDLDKLIFGSLGSDSQNPVLIEINKATDILDRIEKTLVFEEGYIWDLKSHKASLEYLSKNTNNLTQNGKVWLIARTDRNINQKKKDGYSDDPDGGRGEVARAVAAKVAVDIPALILLRQNGDVDKNWRGSPFWWPVIIAPQNTLTTIYSSDTIDL